MFPLSLSIWNSLPLDIWVVSRKQKVVFFNKAFNLEMWFCFLDAEGGLMDIFIGFQYFFHCICLWSAIYKYHNKYFKNNPSNSLCCNWYLNNAELPIYLKQNFWLLCGINIVTDDLSKKANSTMNTNDSDDIQYF